MRDKRLFLHSMVECGGAFWFWELNKNAFFKMNDKYEADIVNLQCYQNKKSSVSLYGKLGKYKHKIMGNPLSADSLLIYDCDKEEDRYISIPQNAFRDKFSWKGKCWDIVIDDLYAYCIGYWSNKIIKVDLEEEIIIDILEINTCKARDIDDIYFKQAILYEDKLIVPSCIRNEVYIVDRNSMTYEIRIFNGTNDGFASCIADGNTIWMAPRRTGRIVRWNLNTEEIDYLEYPNECYTNRPSYGFMNSYDGYIYVFPLHAPFVLRINPQTNEIEIDRELSEICQNDGVIQKTGFVVQEGDNLKIHRWVDSSIVIYDMKECKRQINKIMYTRKCMVSLMQEELNRSGFLSEYDFSLQLFLQNIDGLYGGIRHE